MNRWWSWAICDDIESVAHEVSTQMIDSGGLKWVHSG